MEHIAVKYGIRTIKVTDRIKIEELPEELGRRIAADMRAKIEENISGLFGVPSEILNRNEHYSEEFEIFKQHVIPSEVRK